MSEKSFDYSSLVPWEVSVVRIRGLDGTVREYILREPTAGGVTKWRTAVTKGAKVEDDKVVGMDNLQEAQLVLVAECLSEVARNDAGAVASERPVEVGTVRGFRPGRVAGDLYREIIDRSPWLYEAPDANQKADADPKGNGDGSSGIDTTAQPSLSVGP